MGTKMNIDEIINFIKKNAYTIGANIVILLFGIVFFIAATTKYDELKNPPELKPAQGIQNHLLWSVAGECFFVRQYNEHTNYLIRTKDCDKK
jgi:hypothetical protein